MRRTSSRTPKQIFQSCASWIWDAATIHAQGSTAYLKRTFALEKQPKTAAIQLAADDYCEVFVNNRKAGYHTSWSLVKAIDIAPLLKQGENTILVKVADSGHLPCGFLAEVTLASDGDAPTTLLSDAAWLGSTSPDGPWTPVAVIAPYGEGAWGRRVYREE